MNKLLDQEESMDIRPVEGGEEATLFEIHRAVFYSHIEQIWGWDEDWQKANFAL